MEITVQDKVVLVSRIDPFDHNAADELAASITQRVGDTIPIDVVIDFSDTDGLFSSGIIELMRLESILRSRGGMLVLSGLLPATQAAIEAVHLDTFFMMAEDREAALHLIKAERETNS